MPKPACCAAKPGVTLAEILDFAVPRGWFLPVSPGTKYVTVGGAIANDIHGKNHHVAGTFGLHTPCFELVRSDGTHVVCSATENAEWYAATIGGMGLTGLISWAEVQLRPIVSRRIRHRVHQIRRAGGVCRAVQGERARGIFRGVDRLRCPGPQLCPWYLSCRASMKKIRAR